MKKDFALYDKNIFVVKDKYIIDVEFIDNKLIYRGTHPFFDNFKFDNIKYLENSIFYLVSFRKKDYLIVHHVEGNIAIKQCLDNFGYSLNIIKDYELGGDIVREDGNFSFFINSKDEVLKVEKSIEFKAVKSSLKKSLDRSTPFENIAVLDLC